MINNLAVEITDNLVEEVSLNSNTEVEAFFECLDVKSRTFKTFV